MELLLMPLAALILFAFKGFVWWHFALTLALANVLGSLLGTRLAFKDGAGYVRLVFIGAVSAVILKTGFDAFVRRPAEPRQPPCLNPTSAGRRPGDLGG